MPIRPPEVSEHRSKDQIRQKLGIPEQAYVIVVFGVINVSKNPIAVLEALRRLRFAGVPAYAVFIGWENSEFHLLPEVERRGLQGCVIFLGFLEDRSEVDLWLAAADVGVGLRSIYWGETPSSTLRMMAAGIPVIVNDVGAFSELPEMASVKIPNRDVEEVLFIKLKELYEHQDQRIQMGVYARRYIQEFHHPDRVALSFMNIGRTLVGYDFSN
jgi:glycosyltransferase involved in cell wall biosynthesis